jgi:hypothetical protein
MCDMVSGSNCGWRDQYSQAGHLQTLSKNVQMTFLYWQCRAGPRRSPCCLHRGSNKRVVTRGYIEGWPESTGIPTSSVITRSASRRAESTVSVFTQNSARNEGGRMRIIGCDLHARQQSVAMLDTETSESHAEARRQRSAEFYSQRPRPVLVGIEAFVPTPCRVSAGT